MIGENLVNALDSCEDGCEEYGPCEMREALRYLVRNSERYTDQTEPLASYKGTSKPKAFCTMLFDVQRATMRGMFGTIVGMSTASESGGSTIAPETESELYSFLTRETLSRRTSASLLITAGKEDRILDIFLGQFGERLVADGYVLEPRLSGSQVSCLRISRREGRESWTLTYAETVTGVSISTLVGYAKSVGCASVSGHLSPCSALYAALGAYQDLILTEFDVALSQTVGMIAMQCARRFLPEEYKKWRPDPLMVSMERNAQGYRGGMTYAVRYRGPTLKIDVVRQYTNALRAPLPYRSVFGRYVSPEETPHGVFLCRVSFGNSPLAYPVSVWDQSQGRFRSGTKWVGTHVCVLHTTEFQGLQLHGVDIQPWYGFVFTRVFSLGGFVDRLQSLLDLHGYGSDLSKLLKPLGNYVYGKFGQNPHQQQLRYQKGYPGKGWRAYVDDDLNYWTDMWTKDTTRVTSSQHVEIAGAITGAARSQTLEMWHQCVTSGLTVVRCHTDSLTVTDATNSRAYVPTPLLEQLTASEIGRWRVECLDSDTIVVAANAYADDDGAHVAGLSEPSREMLESVLAGNIVYVTQQQATPRRGYERGAGEIRRRFS